MQHTTLHKLIRVLPALILIVSGLLTVPVALAQDDDSPDDDPMNNIEFIGTIIAVEDGTMLTVDELSVDASEAEINVPVEVGQVVKVEGAVGEDGMILARQISAPDAGDDESTDDSSTDGEDDDSADLELVGTLDSLGDSTALVSGLSFDVTGAEVAPGLESGNLVKVEANFDTETGVWIATELKLADLDDADGVCTFEVEVSSANLRSGPGTGYDVIGFALNSDRLPVVGISASGAWLRVQSANGEAWIAASTGNLDEDCSGLPVSSETEVNDDNANNNDNNNDNASDDNGNSNVSDDNVNSNDNDDDSNNDNDDNSNDNDDDNSNDNDDNGNDNDDD